MDVSDQPQSNVEQHKKQCTAVENNEVKAFVLLYHRTEKLFKILERVSSKTYLFSAYL